jgi:hypothetical protein
MVRNFLCALTVVALGCFCGNVALASSATFAISPNPAATGQAITVTAKINPGVTVSNARLTLWLYNASNNAYAGQASLTGLSYTVNQTTTTAIALPSKLAAGSYYFNSSLYTSGGTGLWGVAHAATFTVGAGTVGGTTSCTFGGKTIASGSSVTAYLASSVPSGQACQSQTRTCSNGTLSGTYGYASCSVQVASGSHSIKWNPGHYLASNGVLKPGGQFIAQPAGTWNQFLAEVNQLSNQDNVVGYSAYVTWSALEPSQDKYDFSQISALLSYLKTHFNKPKHLVLVVMPGKNNSTDARGAIPNYISNSPMYGPSPIAGSYGWWGGKGNGVTAVAALHRPAVMERWIKLHEKLGEAFNGDPNFEAIMFAEDSWVIGASTSNGVPDWNGATNLANWENLVTATTRAFPNTNVILENTWLDTPVRTQQLEDFMLQNRVAPGAMDTYGQTWVDQHGGALNNWGLLEYMGRDISSQYPALGPDMRSRMHSMVFIEPPNLGVYTSSTGYTPADICVALNKSYTASHAFWTYLGNNNTSRPSANWSNVLATINKCPLANAGYPLIYP